MANEFDPTKYGGRLLGTEKQQDPFAAYGGQEINAQPPEQDPFAAYGGQAVSPAPQKKPVEEGDIEEDELQDIADATGVTTDYLKKNLPALSGFTGGYMKGEGILEAAPERLAGEIGRQVFLGVPQKAYILAQDEKEQRALDMLRNLVNEKQTTAQKVAEIGTGLLLPGGVIGAGAKTIAGKLAAGAVTGATYGAAATETGKEAEAAAYGAALGGAFGGVIAGAGKLISKQTEKNAIKYAEDADIVKRAEKELKKEEKQIRNRIAMFADVKQINKILPDLESLRQARAALPKKKTEADIARLELLTKQIRAKEAELQDARKFVGFLNKKEGAASVRDTIKTLKDMTNKEPQFLVREYRNYRLVEAMADAIGDSVAARLPKQSSWLTRMKNSLVDGTIVARWIDRRLAGSDVAVAMDKAAITKRKYDLTMAAKIVEAKGLKDKIKASGVDETKLYRVLDTVDVLGEGGLQKAITAGLNEQEAKLAVELRTSFETIRKEAAELGLKVDEIKAYVPHVRVSTAETIRRINKEAQKAGIDIDNPRATEGIQDLIAEYSQKQSGQKVSYRDYLSSGFKEKLEKPKGLDEFVAKNEAFVNTIRAAEYLSGKRVNNALDLGVALRTFQNPTVLNRIAATEAERSLRRTLDMPDFIREKNIAKLYQDWNANTFRHIYFRDIISALNKNRAFAVKQNDKESARYIDNLMKDLTGLREDTGLEYTRRSLQRFQVGMKKLADAAPEGSFRQSVYETLGDSPELFSMIASQVYPNFLGLSARAVITNMTSPFTMGVPELGGAYGMQKIIGAGLRGVNSMRAGREMTLTPEYAKYLNINKYKGRTDYAAGERLLVKGPGSLTMASKNAGHMGPQYSSELFRAVEGGIKEKALYDLPVRALEKWNNFSMYMFEKSETVIRTLMSDVGESVALDLIAGKGAAVKVLNKMDKAYRRNVTKALEAGDSKEVVKLMQSYLVSRTLFNYDRVSMNEFGRSMGPLFSVFSKWPSTIAGDIIDRFEEKGAMKGGGEVLVRYGGPLAFLMMLDQMVDTLDVSPEKSDVAYRLIGQSGFKGMAPLNSVVPLLEGRIIKPPVIDAMAGGIMALVDADPEALWKWANRTGQTFIPGSGFLRFAAEDVPVFLGEDRVEGPFAERIYKRVTGER